MGSFANTLFTILLGWLQGAVSAVWSAFTSEKGSSFLTWIGDNWILLAGILCLIGLAADLCVYLMRWKPMKVWKSFLFRNRDEEEPEPRRRPAAPPKAYQRTFSAPQENAEPGPAPVRQERYESPDLSQWEEEPARPVPERPEQPAMVTGAGYVVPADSPYRRPEKKNEAFTPKQTEPDEAIRPEPVKQARRPRRIPEEYGDEPRQVPEAPKEEIRRTPAAPAENGWRGAPVREDPPAVRDNRFEAEETYRREEAQPEPIPARTKRRRRLNVSDLFSNPEEDLREIEAPQDVIDRRKAYREPVYPRGWKQNEENRNE